MIRQLVQRYSSQLDTIMRQMIHSVPNEVSDLSVMLQYAMGWVDEHSNPYDRPTGKRLRPTLLLLCNESAGGAWQQALPAAAAVEFLHNFSLIHDDIQDNSPIRHRRPTVWKIWGVANAINAGDALFVHAYRALQYLVDQEIEPALIVKVWQIFNETNLELTRGQHLDMRFEQQMNVSVEEYISMIRGKSAALLAACTQIGALIASGDTALANHYASFGLNIGIAFQIHDDILGIWGDPEITGKSAATDITSRKKSLPILFGLNQSEELKSLYQKTTFDKQDVQRVIQLLDDMNAQEYTIEQESVYYRHAMTALAAASPKQHSEDIHKFVEFLFQRNY